MTNREQLQDFIDRLDMYFKVRGLTAYKIGKIQKAKPIVTVFRNYKVKDIVFSNSIQIEINDIGVVYILVKSPVEQKGNIYSSVEHRDIFAIVFKLLTL